MRRLALAALMGAGWAVLSVVPASAQIVLEGHQQIDFDRPEAWAMKYFASVSIPSGFGSLQPLEAGELDVALEYVQIPSLSEDERRVGFGGAKVEDLNKAPYVIRPVARFGLGRKLALAASWVPPVDRNGAEANLFALALGRPLHEGEIWSLGLRVHGQVGTVEGDFTCSKQQAAAGNDPAANPFGCEAPSSDEYDLLTLGLELSAAWELGAEGRWEPYVALSYNWMDLEFQVNARYSGLIDRTLLATDGQTVHGLAGLAYRFGDRWRLATSVFYSPLDVVRPPSTSTQTDELVNLRLLLSYEVH